MAMYWPDARLMVRGGDGTYKGQPETDGEWTVIRVSPDDLEDYHVGGRLARQVHRMLRGSRTKPAGNHLPPALVAST